MATRNAVTGDEIKSKVGDTKAFSDGWDRIWGNKQKVEQNETAQEVPVDEAVDDDS